MRDGRVYSEVKYNRNQYENDDKITVKIEVKISKINLTKLLDKASLFWAPTSCQKMPNWPKLSPRANWRFPRLFCAICNPVGPKEYQHNVSRGALGCRGKGSVVVENLWQGPKTLVTFWWGKLTKAGWKIERFSFLALNAERFLTGVMRDEIPSDQLQKSVPRRRDLAKSTNHRS